MVPAGRSDALFQEVLEYEASRNASSSGAKDSLFIKKELIPKLNDYFSVAGRTMIKDAGYKVPIGFFNVAHFSIDTVPRIYDL